MTVENNKHQSNPLEQFIVLAKSTKGMAAVELIKQVLEAPGIYVFNELIEMPTIAELKDGEHKPYLDLLNIFAYGTYKEYTSKRESLPEINSIQKKKLQYLTIVTLSEDGKCIPYKKLLEELDIGNLRELEDLIIEAIYAEIIQGKLDQKRAQLEVDTTIGRDIQHKDIPQITSTLESWCEACENVLSTLQTQLNKANAEKSLKNQRKNELDQEITNLKKTLKDHVQDPDEVMSSEALGIDKTPKKVVKKGLRGSTKLFK